MENLNCSCPECGKKFHACRSCGLNYNYEYEYCSFECYKKSFKYDAAVKRLLDLIRLSREDITKLDDLTYFLQEEIDDMYLLFLDEDIKEVWYNA